MGRSQKPLTTEETVEFWQRLGHGPDDGCPADPPSGIKAKPWRKAHSVTTSPTIAQQLRHDYDMGTGDW